MFSIHLPRAAMLAVGVILVILSAPDAGACVSSPLPRCARTLVVSLQAPPMVVELDGPIAIDVPALVYMNVVESPAGACGFRSKTASGPGADLDIVVDATCTDGSGIGGFGPASISSGFTNVTIPVVLGLGGPRICTLSATATATFADGAILTANSDSNVCVGEAADIDPSLPRLDIRTADSTNIQRVHPGDQAVFSYRITNNDATQSYSGKLDVSSVNVSRMPTMTSRGPADDPDDGPYSVAQPVSGDNFPLGFAEDLVNGCLYIPDDTGNTAPSRLNKFIDLAPGESTLIDIYSRPFGPCADGSCSTSVIVLDGAFSDASEGLACAGFVVAADRGAAPQYAWAQSGNAATVTDPPVDFVVELTGAPTPDTTLPLTLIKSGADLQIAGMSFSADLVPQSDVLDDGRSGRISVSVGTPGIALVAAGTTFQFSAVFDVSPGLPLFTQFTRVRPVSPQGSEHIGRGAVLTAGFDNFFDPGNQFFYDFVYQLSGDAVYSDGSRGRVILSDLNVILGPFPPSFQVIATGEVPDAPGATIDVFAMHHDVRAFARGNADFDLDTVTDDLDNCILVANTDQRDTNGDDYGNHCDPDLDNNLIVNFGDLGALKNAFFSTPVDSTWNPDADFDGDDSVNFLDLGVMKKAFFGAPGPSGPAP